MARLSQGYVDDFGQEDVDRAAATAAMDRKTKPSLRRVALDPNAPKKARRAKAQARLDKIKASKQPVVKRVDTPAPQPEPTYGGRPASEIESASGSRVEVSKKEMKALTNKNYENLPEVRKKKEDEQKKQELRKRLEMARKIKK